MVHGLPAITHIGQLCDTCVITKQRREPFLLLVDNATRYMWVALLTAKSAATDAIKYQRQRVHRCGIC